MPLPIEDYALIGDCDTDYTVVVVTEGNDPPGLAYIAPYAATSIAEYFMEAGP